MRCAPRLRGFLKKPLLPVWLSPESRLVEGMLPACPPDDLPFTPVICVSASKVVTPERHREHHSWVYIQGAGDDEEHWSSGLTPEKLWEHFERLVGLAKGGDRGAFEDAMEGLLLADGDSKAAQEPPKRDQVPGGKEGPLSPGRGLSEDRAPGAINKELGRDGGWCVGDWHPGGPEIHALLGSTGLAVGSVAFAANKWARQCEDCSLLNLSDEPFPEDLVRFSTGSGRRYLHIPLKAGKRANPPRYWKTKVFPLALEFIAATVAGMGVRCGRRADIHETASSKPLDSAQSDRAAVIERAISRSKDTVGESSSREAEETTIADVGGSGGAGGCASRVVNPGYTSEIFPECRFSPVSTDTVEGSGDSSLGPNEGVVVGHSVCSTPLAATSGAGRCLVVCPTGAEASVVICLAALIAFYPSSRGSPEKGGNRSPPAQLAGEKLGSSPGSRGSEKIDVYGKLEAGYLGGVRGGFEVLRRGDGAVSKADVRWRFLLLQQECPWARPPRRLMQELNEYFMTPGEHSWWTLSDRFL